MCNIYTGTPTDRYDSDCRSIRIQGCVTSIRLENEFWEILDQMALEEKQTVPQFINVLYDEILDTHKDVANFTSFLRVACAIYLHRKGELKDDVQGSTSVAGDGMSGATERIQEASGMMQQIKVV